MSCRKDDNAKRLDRYNMMTGLPIHRLILKLAVPTIISMMVTALYNLVDA
jgi:Na+-driven multidrug efflux pump